MVGKGQASNLAGSPIASKGQADGVAMLEEGGRLPGQPSPAGSFAYGGSAFSEERAIAKLNKRRAIVAALWVLAVSYLSVVMFGYSRALATTHNLQMARKPAFPPSRPPGAAATEDEGAFTSGVSPGGATINLDIGGASSITNGARVHGDHDATEGAPGEGAEWEQWQLPAAAAERIHWPAVLPNQGRSEASDQGVDVDCGTRSQHYGAIQRQRQNWLERRINEIREEGGEEGGGGKRGPEGTTGGAEEEGESRRTSSAEAEANNSRRVLTEEVAGLETVGVPEGGRDGTTETDARKHTPQDALVGERLTRVQFGIQLWNATYVPPIEPERRRKLIDKWSGNAARRENAENVTRVPEAEEEEIAAGRILYVMSSFDRGQRLGPKFRDQDKLDYILLMMDEMREACEAGFSPHVHLIAAWEIAKVEPFVRDRLFCRRTRDYVPYTFEEHPSSVGNDLCLKHRVYMKPKLDDFDIFLQVEDDIILTLNHIVLFQEESELLDNRRLPDGSHVLNTAVPGFIRIEHLHGDKGPVAGPGSSGADWLEWEVLLSRFHPVRLTDADTYLTLGPSKPLPRGGNNQGMWMATQDQLRVLSQKKSCGYLSFDENSSHGHVETHSGSIQMFGTSCGFQKVLPARRFESFLVHHRTNNKLGIRGESIPGVPMDLLREWVEQFIRDESELKSVWNVPT